MSTWTDAIGRAMDRLTPWARDIERAEALRDNPPVIEPEPELTDEEIERICADEERRIDDYWGGVGPTYDAALAEHLIEHEADEFEEAGRNGDWAGVMDTHAWADWGREVLAQPDLEAGAERMSTTGPGDASAPAGVDVSGWDDPLPPGCYGADRYLEPDHIGHGGDVPGWDDPLPAAVTEILRAGPEIEAG